MLEISWLPRLLTVAGGIGLIYTLLAFGTIMKRYSTRSLAFPLGSTMAKLSFVGFLAVALIFVGQYLAQTDYRPGGKSKTEAPLSVSMRQAP